MTPSFRLSLRCRLTWVERRSRPGAPYLPDDRDTPVTIGETTEYRMDIWDTSYTLAPGHRLRFWLGSSDTPTHEPLPVAGRNLVFHDRDHPSRLLLGTGVPELRCSAGPESCPPAPPPPRVPAACRRRPSFTVSVPRGLRRVRVTVSGRRARIRHRGRRAYVIVRPRARVRTVVVRIRGVNRRGRRVTTVRRYRVCR